MTIFHETLVSFDVISVNYEPHSESTWVLEYQGWGPIMCLEIFNETFLSDEKLIGKEIRAQVVLKSDEFTPGEKFLKSISYEKGVYASGQIIKIYREEFQGMMSFYFILDSVFPMVVDLANYSDKEKSLKEGDWIKFSGYLDLNLPRGVYLM